MAAEGGSILDRHEDTYLLGAEGGGIYDEGRAAPPVERTKATSTCSALPRSLPSDISRKRQLWGALDIYIVQRSPLDDLQH